MKLKTKKILNICCFSLLIISTITASVAWFVSNKDVNVTSDTELICEGGNSLEISMLKSDGSWTPWSKKITQPGPKASMEDITGNGLNLYKPGNLESNQDGDLHPTIFEPAEKITDRGGQFIELEVKIRSLSYLDLYFSGESSITPIDLTKPGQVGSTSSPDYIAGATRVAVIERKERGDVLKMLWAPHPEYKYVKEENKVIIDSNTQNFEKYHYMRPDSTGKPEEVPFTHEQYARKEVVIGSTGATTKMINNSPVIATLDPTKLQNQYAEAHLVFRIWFEGTDREAVLPLSGGHVNVKINLVGNNSKYNLDSDKRHLMTAIECSNETLIVDPSILNTILISNDGHNWEQYANAKDYVKEIFDEMRPLPEGSQRTLYFKYPEQTDTLEFITRMDFNKKKGGVAPTNAYFFSNIDLNKERPKEVPANEKK